MKLRQGNIFTGVCLSACLSLQVGGGPHVTITHDVLDLTVQTPTLPATDPGPVYTLDMGTPHQTRRPCSSHGPDI